MAAFRPADAGFGVKCTKIKAMNLCQLTNHVGVDGSDKVTSRTVNMSTS